MGLRWLEQSEEDPLVYQTGHRQLKCIIGKVQGGGEEEGEQAQADNFSEPIRLEAGRSRSGRPTTRYVL